MLKVKTQRVKSPLLDTVLLTLLLVLLSSLAAGCQQMKIRLSPEDGVLMTERIQQAIDSCAQAGGGTIIFTEGTFLSGGLELRSHVRLHLEEGSMLRGSQNYADYKNDAFLFGSGLEHLHITGGGIIDGVDCNNPNGEEGFRGPHCIRLLNCKHLVFKNFTIVRSANWAFNLRHCSYGELSGVIIRGGHDGLHTRFCDNFTVSECDFRTGDDAFAGNDNRDFQISDCKINTSCNGFRMGCLNLTVKRCYLWGPGESEHKVQQRNNMLSAFVHFSPDDENPQQISGNWLIEDITVENVDRFYVYNFRNGLWQTGQPASSITFNRIEASGILNAFSIIGDAERNFRLELSNSSFNFREGSEEILAVFEGREMPSSAFFYAREFNEIKLSNIHLVKKGSDILLDLRHGNKVTMQEVYLNRDQSISSYYIQDVDSIDVSLSE